MKIPGIIIGLGIAALAAVLWFLLANPDTERPELRIATNPWAGYEFLHLAQKKGFFEEEGVSVKLVRFSELEDARRAYERRQVDGMASTLVELLQAHEHGRPAKVILMLDCSEGADVVLARKDIHSLAELKGKKIGIGFESLSVFVIERALEKAGLSLNDVQLVNMSPLSAPQALLKGEIDATHTYPPYSNDLLKHTDTIVKLMDSSEMPGEIADVLSFDPDIIAQRIDDIKAIRRAWNKAVLYARAHPDEANKIMADMEGISAKDFSQALAGIKVMSLDEQRPIMVYDGKLERVLIRIYEILYADKAKMAPLQPTDYVAHIKDDP